MSSIKTNTTKRSLFSLVAGTLTLHLFINLINLHIQQNLLVAVSGQQFARAPPAPLTSASHLSTDGLTLVIVFDKPVNLSAAVETIERRRVFEWGEQSLKLRDSSTSSDTISYESSNSESRASPSICQANQQKLKNNNQALHQQQQQQNHHLMIQGIQLCAKLLTKKTLKLLHKYRVHNCIWPSRVQFLIQLGKPALNNGNAIKISFQRNTLSEHNQPDGQVNERELSVELNRLPLESLGVPLAPRVALTGPNQVASCGHFSLSAHLSSPFGTQPGEQVRLSWSVERVGFAGVLPVSSAAASGSSSTTTSGNATNSAESQQQLWDLRWRTLQALVANNQANHLVLDTQLLQFAPQLYEFRLSVTFITSLSSVTVNASHQLNRLDFDAPTGIIYGSHLLSAQAQHNPTQELLLLADVQVPECASNIKQVGLYWQVSDSRVRFEQTYAPYYLAAPNTLPEQALIEFRVNLFYGIRVKKFSSTGSLVATGESALDAQISNGLLIATVGQDSPDNGNQLELFALTANSSFSSMHNNQQQKNNIADNQRFNYLWSCFDGKTAQPCQRNPKSLPATMGANNSTRYELQVDSPTAPTLIDRQNQRQSTLRLPLSWLQSDAQLWFGLQRFDAQTQQVPSSATTPANAALTEYALVSLQSDASPMMSIGPVLIGSSRRRATIRNPLTGALLLVEGARVVVVGRLSNAQQVRSFAWQAPNQVQPLHWTSREERNSQTGQTELITELHLNPNLLVAHAHLELQLVVCNSETVEGLAKASLHLDVVQGVNQCRVEATAAPGALLVSANHCNIPLGLSPITYQLYAADTTGIDGFGAVSSQSTPNDSTPAEDDYTNEADEAHLYLLAQPMSAPQLSPVFPMGSATASAMLTALAMSNAGAASGNISATLAQSRLRFGMRVCDRLQSCRMFYSSALGPKQLLAPNAADSTSNLQLLSVNNNNNNQDGSREQVRAALVSLQSAVESARRVNLAGNSLAAMGVLSGVIDSTERLVGSSSSPAAQLDERRTRELLQVAMRDCIQYGAQSLQRQFHYTEAGQTSLATHVLSRVLSSTQSNLEFKFKALRLVTQLTKRSISEQLNLKLNCLADMKTLQLGYESLLATFSHYSLDPNTDIVANTEANDNINNNNNNNINSSSSLPSATLWRHFTSSSSSTSLPYNKQQQHNSNNNNQTTSVNRKKREEAILAYLKSVRLAYRALLSSAAIQLPLGDTQQFQYSREAVDLDPLSSARSHSLKVSSSSSSSSPSSSSASLVAAASSTSNGGTTTTTTTTATSKQQQSTSSSLSSDIVSSLTHLTELSNTIELDLHEFGSISVKFNQDSLTNLKAQLSARQLRCRNVSTLTTSVSSDTPRCSSFILSVSSFAGKAPFRSLDLTQNLRVPVLELSLLSPIDGTNLLELQSTDNAQQPLDFKVTVAFTLPKAQLLDAIESSGNSAEQLSSSPSSSSSHRRRYKCYQFNEEVGEWRKSSLGELQELDEAQVLTNADTDETQRKVIRCTFSGLGVYGAFLGKPPTSEASMSSPVVLAVLAVIGLALLFAIYACFAATNSSITSSSSSSTANQSRKGSDAKINDDDVDDDEETINRLTNGTATRHPEQSHRNEFGYPLPM